MSAKKSRWRKSLDEIAKLDLQEDEKVVVKVVPAKVDGEIVGETYLYDDGSFDMHLADDISTEAMMKLEEFGLSSGTLKGRLH